MKLSLFRGILFYLGIGVVTLPYFVLAMLLLLTPLKTRLRVLSSWARLAVFWLRITCGLSYRVSFAAPLPSAPYLVLANHASAWETIALPLIFYPAVPVLKKSLLAIPFFGWGLATLKPIAIDRASPRQAARKMLAKARMRIKEGFSVIVFPEGTRQPPGTLGHWQPGGAWLARKLGIPVVPVAHNAGFFWPRRAMGKRPGLIEVKVGPPLYPGMRAEELLEKSRAWVAATLPTLGKVAAGEKKSA